MKFNLIPILYYTIIIPITFHTLLNHKILCLLLKHINLNLQKIYRFLKINWKAIYQINY